MSRCRLFPILFAVALCGAAGVLAGGRFSAELYGVNEVPPLTTQTTGSFELTFDKDETGATFELELLRGLRITQAHIHCAPQGTNGPVVAFLAGLHALGWDVDGLWVANARLTDENVMPQGGGGPCPNAINDLRDLADAARAGNLYVNAHSVINSGGEVRGQLVEQPADDDENDDGDDEIDDSDGDRVCLCHASNQSPANRGTLCVDQHAVRPHLAHGDVLGECGCGGPAGESCNDGEFCELAAGTCGDHAGSVCAAIPEVCPLIFAPVCGCDGNAYDNACLASAASVSIDRPGYCARTCFGAAGEACVQPDRGLPAGPASWAPGLERPGGGVVDPRRHE